MLREVEQHELACVQAKSLVAESCVDRAAERHELRFDAMHLRERAHAVKHFFEQPPPNGFLVLAGGNVQAADQAFVVLEDIEAVSDGHVVFDGHAAGERMGVEEALDQIEGAAIVPVKLVAPMTGLFEQERLKLADGRLAQVDNVHWAGLTRGPRLHCHDSRFAGGTAKSGREDRYKSDTMAREDRITRQGP